MPYGKVAEVESIRCGSVVLHRKTVRRSTYFPFRLIWTCRDLIFTMQFDALFVAVRLARMLRGARGGR